MGPTSIFQLPGAMKRSRMSFVPASKQRKEESSGLKAHDILGVSRADIDDARNQSISSSATTKLPSFSDATTEAGSQANHSEQLDLLGLKLKASSVLLHDEYLQGTDAAHPVRSGQLKKYDSNSTLHSHYDATKAPLSVSQQTSDSSRRDFALRKGSPIVVKSTTPEKDVVRQLKLFRSSKSLPKPEARKLTKSGPASQRKTTPVSGSQESIEASDRASVVAPGTPRSAASSDSFLQRQKGTQTFPSHNSTKVVPEKRSLKKAQSHSVLEEPHLKVNIRRPKVGAKHWFDGLEGETSEDESIHEPELQSTFVNGLESAFHEGRIGFLSMDASTIASDATHLHDTDPSSTSLTSSRYSTPLSPIEPKPKISVLNAKASKSSLIQSRPEARKAKRKQNPLVENDLNQCSVLYLSSEDDDEEDDFDISGTREPAIRDSLMRDSVASLDVEFGTAKAVRAEKTLQPPTTPRQRLEPHTKNSRHSSTCGARRPRIGNRTLTYLSDSSSQLPAAEGDLLTSFPATPSDSRRASLRSSECMSDSASIESRRLMSVTRQEESLLAAMRLTKAAMKQSSSQDNRLNALKSLERGSQQSRLRAGISSSRSEASSFLNFANENPWTSQHQHISSDSQSMSGDEGIYSRASGTTFQSGTSVGSGARLSTATFTNKLTNEPQSRLSLSSQPSFGSSISPTLLPVHHANVLSSRDTYFPTTNGDYSKYVHTARGGNRVVPLDGLEPLAKRNEVRSQDFISWPYNGWEIQAELGMAH